MKKAVTLIFICLISSSSFSQGPGEPYNPMTANGATGISRYGHILFWENLDSTVYNRLYFSDDSSLVNSFDTSAILIDGYPDSVFFSASFSNFEPLEYFTKYYWRVVEYTQTDSTIGPVWYFRTKTNSSFPTLFFDDFDNSNYTNMQWSIINDGGDCIWQQYFPPYPNSYTLPDSSVAGVLSADSDECGPGTILKSSAVSGSIYSPFYWEVYLEFDQDFNTIGIDDEAWVEVSTDNGATWEAVWSKVGVELRNTHEIVEITNYVQQSIEFFLKFRSVQPGWDWWWTIDNVKVWGYGPITPPEPPYFIQAFSDTSNLEVQLNWVSGFCPDPITAYEIQRKNGLPLDTSSYSVLAVVDGNTFTYTDSTVLHNSNYTYKIKTLCGPPGQGSIWGNEATAYVPDIITSVQTKNALPTEFYLEQNYPNPFNPTTTIKFTIPSNVKRQTSKVSLIVYDVLGREIATLVNEEKPAGSYEVEFNSQGLTSGIYFYTFKVGSFIESKKMILLK